MKIYNSRISLALVVVIFVAQAHAMFETRVEIKKSEEDAGGYFDPHNHLNGVLPYKLWGAISDSGIKVIDQFLASGDGAALKILLGTKDNIEATLLIRRYLAHHSIGRRGNPTKVAVKDTALLTGMLDNVEALVVKQMWAEMAGQKSTLNDAYFVSRLGPGTKVLTQILECKPVDTKNTKRLLQQLLTATPQTDFDTAYVARGMLKVTNLLPQMEATLDELYFDQIKYVELSHPIGRINENELLAPNIIELMNKHETRWGTQVRWLPMLLTNVLADSGKESILTLNKKSGECSEEMQKPFLMPVQRSNNEKSMLEKVLAHGLVVGVDLASPERACYTKKGAENLKSILTTTFEVAKSGTKRLVVHIHVGEGFPAFSEGKTRCNAPPLKELPAFPIKYKAGVPVHYVVGSRNVEVLLDAVSEFRASLGEAVSSFDDHVVVRFGHVTHATQVQANRMRENNIWADINLTSNLATGALSLDSGDVTQSETVESYTPRSPGNLRKLAADPSNAALFKNHALATLLTSGVKVVLGTDGGGIEHSSMPNEYTLAKWILKEQGAPDLFKKLYIYQKQHYDFISARPST